MRQLLTSILIHAAILIGIFYQFDFAVISMNKQNAANIELEKINISNLEDLIDVSLEDEQPEQQAEESYTTKAAPKPKNKSTYQKAISSHVGKHFKQFIQGENLKFSITLLLKVNSDGKIIIHSTSEDIQNKHLKELIDRIINASDPVPAPPKEFLKDGFATFAIPIKYNGNM